ncbi:MAG: hypothetical protein ACJ71Z_02275 [Aeromicrobium sp.]
MTRSGSWLVWLVAVLAGIVTVPMLWVAENVANEDGWVTFTAGFVEDEQLRNGVVDAAAEAMLARASLPPEATRLFNQALQDLVRTATTQPGFIEAWRESLRRTHRLNFDPDAHSTRLRADIGPLATFVAHDVSEQLPVRLTVPDRVVVPIHDKPDERLIAVVASSPRWGKIGLVIVGIALLASMGMAGGVAGALRRFGLAFVAVAGLMLVATGVALPKLLAERTASSDFARQMQDLLLAHTAHSLNNWAITLGVVGVVASVVGVVGGLASRGVSHP